jgi:hypothetical protein
VQNDSEDEFGEEEDEFQFVAEDGEEGQEFQAGDDPWSS